MDEKQAFAVADSLTVYLCPSMEHPQLRRCTIVRNVEMLFLVSIRLGIAHSRRGGKLIFLTGAGTMYWRTGFLALSVTVMSASSMLLGSCDKAAIATPQRYSATDLLDAAFPEPIVLIENVAAFKKAASQVFDRSRKLSGKGGKDPSYRDGFISNAALLAEQKIRKELPSLRAECIRIYKTNLSDQEIQDLTAFFRTKSGQKIVRLGIEGSARSNAVTQEESRRDAKRYALASVDESDREAINALTRSTAYGKLRPIGVKIQEVNDRFFTRINSELASDLDRMIASS